MLRFRALLTSLVLLFFSTAAYATSSDSLAVEISASSLSVAPGDTVEVVLSVDDVSGKSITAFSMDLSWDEALVSFVSLSVDDTITQQAGMNLFSNTDEKHTLNLAAAGVAFLAGSGALVRIRFIAGDSTGTSALAIQNALFNEGNPSATPVDGEIRIATDTSIAGGEQPAGYVLGQNYPNPFNPSTLIVYTLPEVAHVQLSVYDALGRQITQLVDRQQGAGTHQVHFQAQDLPSGLYFYQITAGEFSATRRMLLVK